MSGHKRLLRAGFAAASVATVITGSVKAEPTLDMTWKPVSDVEGEVFAIAVKQVVNGVAVADGKPLSFSAPVVYAAVTGVADRIQNLQVSDAQGVVALTVDEDKPVPGGMPYYRHWRAARAVTYPVTVSYTAGVQPPGSPSGPAFGIRPAEGGISGSGGGFLLLPENAGTTVTRVAWDLSALPPGSMGVTTFGEGAFEVNGDPDAVTEGWIMAGPLHHLASKDNRHFHAYWLGKPTFDAEAEMAWAAKGYDVLSRSYKYLDPAPDYRVFLRVLDTPPYGGGTALGNSFMLSMASGKARDIHDTRITIFHEMGHQWAGDFDGGVASAWFIEGLNVYYTTLLPLRGGLVSVEDYGKLLNAQARDYYTSPALHWSAAKIVETGFGDEKIRHTPYMRGQLYFADLDAQIRKKSHGKHTLDSFLAPMFVARHNGAKIDQPYWEAMLLKELGPQAVMDFRAINIDGTKVIDPASASWGPCFRRQATSMKSGDEAVIGYQWVRVKNVPDDRCANW
ncbi:hypothetical protein [Asticcacaulis sp. 201]|uniref:M61 family metallopeptidase n=1 Tax=Asticcacaulis sp. 201 TaxID=3028787 RepID=UPI0029163FCE|nr:hypothetical protein [Asticcacaulis sp. 201]MDV6332952.1 hypothetical protein [Asticcacaulis sp. 201]